MAYLNMDLTDTQSGLGFGPVPAGEYQAWIIDSELTRSQSELLMLNLAWQIMSGEHLGRQVFDRAMLEGSDKAVIFGKRKIKTIAEAVGHANPNRVNDTEELHGRPCLITVAVQEFNGENRNEIKNYRPLRDAAPPDQSAAAASVPGNKTPPPPVELW